MAFPSEFQFENELQFVNELIIPLLQRLGFVMVANYHGTHEFGKDVVFAEIDRFGHVQYHGLQAKYVASIGLSGAGELIEDCKQAFNNPFRHPHTGTDERISSFYVVNGGSISEPAQQQYFNSLISQYGANVRLLDGKSLISLDRGKVSGTRQDDLARLNGLLLEFSHDRYEAEVINKMVDGRHENGKCVIPLRRLRLSAMEDFLRSPIALISTPARDESRPIGWPEIRLSPSQVQVVWHNFWLANKILDSIMYGGAQSHREEMAQLAVSHINQVLQIMDKLEKHVKTEIEQRGPLCAV